MNVSASILSFYSTYVNDFLLSPTCLASADYIMARCWRDINDNSDNNNNNNNEQLQHQRQVTATPPPKQKTPPPTSTPPTHN